MREKSFASSSRSPGPRWRPLARCGERCAAFDGFRPDVLVSDVGMPDEDGYGLIRHVRAREVGAEGHIPAIALTGYVSAEDNARLLAAGFQIHLPKPVDPDALVSAVASLAALGSQ